MKHAFVVLMKLPTACQRGSAFSGVRPWCVSLMPAASWPHASHASVCVCEGGSMWRLRVCQLYCQHAWRGQKLPYWTERTNRSSDPTRTSCLCIWLTFSTLCILFFFYCSFLQLLQHTCALVEQALAIMWAEAISMSQSVSNVAQRSRLVTFLMH